MLNNISALNVIVEYIIKIFKNYSTIKLYK